MITVDGEQRKVGLALSGGGFRASAFHMGVLRRLSELGILPKIDVISSVSGGSIVGAYYVLNRHRWDDIESVERDFKRGLQANIRLRALTGSAFFHPVQFLRGLSPGFSRTNILASEYARHFFGQCTLSDLPEHPELNICATCLNTGNGWFFTKHQTGDYELGVFPAPGFPVSKAVAASSAVPGLIPPLVVKKSEVPCELAREYRWLGLLDGGVADNLGLSPLFRNLCNYIIVSDASGHGAYLPNPPKLALRVLLRSYGITMSHSQGAHMSPVFSRSEVKQGAICTITTLDATDGPPRELVELAAQIRTDLDYFSNEEISVLMHIGYTALDRIVNRYFGDWMNHAPQSLRWMVTYDESTVRQLRLALRKSHRLRLRPFRYKSSIARRNS